MFLILGLVFLYILIGFFIVGTELFESSNLFKRNKFICKVFFIILWPPLAIYCAGIKIRFKKNPKTIVNRYLIDSAIDACTISYNSSIYEAIIRNDLEQLRLLFPIIQDIRFKYYSELDVLPRTVKVKDRISDTWDMVWGEELPSNWHNRTK